MIGQTISHYKIAAKLGEGGMGVVYKAEDLKLGRAVALKFLPAHLLDSEEHKARFLHEARAAALLDHPNICTVYEIDEAGGQTFLAMACLEGQTLKQKIAERPLPLNEALDIAIQIGLGLQAAHEKGVVHRDIKPANVMITSQGQVKIMDFGLAQLSDRTKLTATGTKLGTPAYMSPEQTEGKPADRRSDIWSLGVVLYEMVSGRTPFQGESEATVAYAIVRTEPEPLTALRSGLPIDLDRIVSKALEKSPEGRYQHVEDLAVDLKALRDGLIRAAVTAGEPRRSPGRDAGSGSSGAGSAEPPRATARLAWVLAALSLAIAAAFGALYLRKGAAPDELISFEFATGTPPTESYAGAPAISPDGRAIAYVARDETGAEVLFVRGLDTIAGRALAGTQNARRPFWSPDGRWMAFFADGQLKKIDPSGGPAISVSEAEPGLGGAWSTAGEIVFAPGNRTPLHRIAASGGESLPITALDPQRQENSHRWPQFLPDGRRFLFTIRAADPENTVLAAGSLDSSEVKRLFRVQSNVRFVAVEGEKGYLLFARDKALVAVPFDPGSLEVRGESLGVTQDLLHNAESVFADFSASDDGRMLVYRRGSLLRQLTWFNRDGNRGETIGPPGAQVAPRISADGGRLVFSMPERNSGNRDVWVMEMATGVSQRLISAPSNDWQAVWSPDGSRIAFTSDRKGGKQALYQTAAAGGGAEELVHEEVYSASSWSLDGRSLLTNRDTSGGLPRLWLMPMKPLAEPIPFRQPAWAETDGHFSPDSRWIAYTSNESGQYEVYVASSPTASPAEGPLLAAPRRVSIAGGAGARWRRDGRELYFLTPDHKLMSVDIRTADQFEASPPKLLFPTCETFFWTLSWQSTYEPAGDGRRFLFNCPVESASALEVVVNWTARLVRHDTR